MVFQAKTEAKQFLLNCRPASPTAEAVSTSGNGTGVVTSEELRQLTRLLAHG